MHSNLSYSLTRFSHDQVLASIKLCLSVTALGLGDAAVGLTSGGCYVGFTGPVGIRTEYTAIASHVNLSARLMMFARRLRGKGDLAIVTDQITYLQARSVYGSFDSLPAVSIKGLKSHQIVYQPQIPRDGSYLSGLKRHRSR